MMSIQRFSKYEFGKLITPEKIYKLKFKKELEGIYQKLYFDNVNYVIVTNLFALSIILSMIVFVIGYPLLYSYLGTYIGQNFFYQYGIYIITWFLLNLGMYYSFLLSYFLYQDSKFKKIEHEIEKDLPDFIDNLVSNLKGGISLEKAILQSVRSDQKVLLKEVTLINEKIMMGKSVIESISEFRKRFDSAIINRTFFLMEEGLKGGGNLSEPLERISENLKRIYNLDEEIKSSSSGFTVIISFISVIIAPLLFALALTLLSFISNLFDLLSSNETTLVVVGSIPDEFRIYLSYFSYGMIVLITFFSSLIIAHLKNEKAYKVVKYLPVSIVGALLLYNIILRVLLSFFGNII